MSASLNLAGIVLAAILLLLLARMLLGDRGQVAAARRRRDAVRPAKRPPAAAGADPDSMNEDGGGIEVREHDSAIDAAQMLLDLGHAPGAVQVLTQFIEHNPKQAVAPWLKLLEIYRKAGARSEFEAISGALNRHFNVRALSWEQAPCSAAGAGIEAYPHIVAQIVHRWGTHACHHYLGRLLADNRDGARSGFTAGALHDILFLTDMLEAGHVGPQAAGANARAGSIAERLLQAG